MPPMQSHVERRVVQHPPEVMYAVVADVAKYEEFVPWCVSSRVLRGDERAFEAELSVGFRMVTESYVSRVSVEPPTFVRAQGSGTAVFNHLVNEWRLSPGPTPHSCQIDFRVEFQFKNAFYASLSSVFLDEVARRMISAFASRATALERRRRQRESAATRDCNGSGRSISAPSVGPSGGPGERRASGNERPDAGAHASPPASADVFLSTGQQIIALLGDTAPQPALSRGAFTTLVACVSSAQKARYERRLRGPAGVEVVAAARGVRLGEAEPVEVQEMRVAAEVAAGFVGSVDILARDVAPLANHQFRALDKAERGRLDAADIAAYLSVLLVGSREERADFMFRCYDQDREGFVTRRELKAHAMSLARSHSRTMAILALGAMSAASGQRPQGPTLSHALGNLHTASVAAHTAAMTLLGRMVASQSPAGGDRFLESARKAAGAARRATETVASLAASRVGLATPTAGGGRAEPSGRGARARLHAWLTEHQSAETAIREAERAYLEEVEDAVEHVMAAMDEDGDGRFTLAQYAASELCERDIARFGGMDQSAVADILEEVRRAAPGGP